MKKFKLISFAFALAIALTTTLAFTPDTAAEESSILAYTVDINNNCQLPAQVECSTESSSVNCKNLSGIRVWKKTSGTSCPTPLYKIIE